ncbi:MAG: four helix bundle protein [Anaerolineales bacterium]
MNYNDWLTSVPDDIKNDALWTVAAYRVALFASDLGWRDTAKLVKNRRLRSLSDQLYRALGSVSANIAEGYSRGSGRDRARFYEYALGSARESRDWYFKARHAMNEEAYQHRTHLLTRTIQLLLKMIPDQRGKTLREPSPPYHTAPDLPPLETLLAIVPDP